MKTVNFFRANIKWFLALSLIIVSVKFVKAQEKATALKGDLQVHDPVMIKEGDTYYNFLYGQRHQH